MKVIYNTLTIYVVRGILGCFDKISLDTEQCLTSLSSDTGNMCGCQLFCLWCTHANCMAVTHVPAILRNQKVRARVIHKRKIEIDSFAQNLIFVWNVCCWWTYACRYPQVTASCKNKPAYKRCVQESTTFKIESHHTQKKKIVVITLMSSCKRQSLRFRTNSSIFMHVPSKPSTFSEECECSSEFWPCTYAICQYANLCHLTQLSDTLRLSW